MDNLNQLVSQRSSLEGSNRAISKEKPENKTAPKRRHSVVSLLAITGLHKKERGNQQDKNRRELRNGSPSALWSVRNYFNVQLSKITSHYEGNHNKVLRRRESCPEWKRQPEEWRRLEEDKNDAEKRWREWGPYLSERQWGTVREDYSYNGSW